MSSTKNRRWILAVLMATVLPALGFHASCVAVIGPGNWGSGLEEKLPELLPASSSPRVLAYAEEFSRPKESPQPAFPGDAKLLKGEIHWADHFEAQNLWAVATHEGENWTDRQHVYLWAGDSSEPNELEITRDMIVDRPTFIKRNQRIELVYGHWNSWAIPPAEKLKRYLRSYLDERLRPEFSLYIYDLWKEARTYFGPGHSLLASPDRERAVFLRSGALGAGYYSIHVWESATGRVETVISLREAGEGSGRSFDYRWSTDSNAIHLSGVTGGFERRKRERRDLDLIYLADEQAVYDAE